MKICQNIRYIGVNDLTIELFEGLYQTPNGMAYNSYLMEDEKTAVMDSVDAEFVDEWLEKIGFHLGERTPDYLVVLHMEPDHSAGILKFMQRYPQATLVSSRRAFVIIGQLFGTQFEDRRIIVDEGDILSLGESQLHFFAAPLVHWPEVMVAYESCSKTLFSADAFGSFGVVTGQKLSPQEWADEGRRYYFGIVGKFGVQTQSLLKKLANLPLERICSLHGPLLDEHLATYIQLYEKWSSYQAEEKGVLIAYTSVYGNTQKAALQMAEILKAEGCEKVEVQNLIGNDLSYALAQAFRFDRLVIATTTYNGGVFPVMETFLRYLTERNLQNKRGGIVQNGSWSPMAGRAIKAMLSSCKDVRLCDTLVTVRSAIDEECKQQLQALAKELCR